MTKQEFTEAIQEANDLAQRFPDLPNYEVFDHVRFVTGTWFGDNSLMAEVVKTAYVEGYDTAVSRWLVFCDFSDRIAV